MTSVFIEPFDFKTILIDYFLGTQELFVFAFIIVLSFASAKFGMSNRVFLTLLVISSIIMGSYLGQSIYILILVVSGFIIFKGVSRFAN